MKTMVYVDAFNLYYGAVRKTPYKWLDLRALCSVMLRPENKIVGIKYFTAPIRPFPDNPQQLNRQKIYFRALRTIANLEIITGCYLSHDVWMPLAKPKKGKPRCVLVTKTEEKGSDVNIATHMMLDAFDNVYECAVLISGDSDLALPVQMVRTRFNKVVGVINPQKIPCKSLLDKASFYKHIRKSALIRSQFPDELHDAQGVFRKPAEWCVEP